MPAPAPGATGRPRRRARSAVRHRPARKRGVEELQPLVKMVPFAPLVRIHLARALEAEGQREAAIAQYATFAVQTSRAEGPLAQLNREAKAALARLAPPR